MGTTYGTRRVRVSDPITATGQLQFGAANITGPGAIVGFAFTGSAADTCLVRDTDGSGQKLLDLQCDVTGSSRDTSIPMEQWRRFLNGVHVTIAGAGGSKRFVAYYVVDE